MRISEKIDSLSADPRPPGCRRSRRDLAQHFELLSRLLDAEREEERARMAEARAGDG